MPTLATGLVLRPLPGECNGVPVASQTSSTAVFNTNSKAKTGTNATGADSQFNPYGVIAASPSVLNHGNIIVRDVPDGASYLDLVHEFRGTNPTTPPIIRVFGEVPPRGDAKKSWPGDLDTDYFNPGFDSGTTDWKPLGAISTNEWAIELEVSTSVVAQDNGTSKRSAPRTINLCGCTRVMVLIDTAATDATEGMVVGWFGR